MRITGGAWRGRKLVGPSGQGANAAIRPTSDRLRESLFNILAHGLGDPMTGARVIDLFAGTGALGLEALSRGARFALLVDDGAEARALIRANVEALGCGGATRVFRRDATKLGAAPAGEPFTLAFLDPPYGKGLAEPALAALRDGGWLAAGALCIVEETGEARIAVPAGFEQVDRRDYGETQMLIVRHAPDSHDKQLETGA
jgi:16S rRNA (guanine966-N2)-methyltransferase